MDMIKARVFKRLIASTRSRDCLCGSISMNTSSLFVEHYVKTIMESNHDRLKEYVLITTITTFSRTIGFQVHSIRHLISAKFSVDNVQLLRCV